MTVDSILNGVVIDHITAGSGMRLFELLKLDRMDVTVALMKNVTSRKMGRKDIIKIDADIPIDLDVIGFVDPGATVNIIRNGSLAEKKSICLPDTLKGVLRCKNPRCIVTTEQELPQIFRLTDPQKRVYRCIYCETKAQ
ncbi:MAG: aspartate carbamoyltransferase regulatory subunit [Clostridia bacterium]|nr:aspartate carbamoyltransferase regulatory subunit [Clostridia bacterium]MBR0536877.1 aspartate carbamoyltransferase regulatory subunit [Clostridia bacterium]